MTATFSAFRVKYRRRRQGYDVYDGDVHLGWVRKLPGGRWVAYRGTQMLGETPAGARFIAASRLLRSYQRDLAS